MRERRGGSDRGDLIKEVTDQSKQTNRQRPSRQQSYEGMQVRRQIREVHRDASGGTYSTLKYRSGWSDRAKVLCVE